MQSLSNAAGAFIWAVLSVLIGPTVILLLLRRYLPMVGNPLWRQYCRLLAWAVIAPFRLLRMLTREALSRRR
jgi:hypothetical protein